MASQLEEDIESRCRELQAQNLRLSKQLSTLMDVFSKLEITDLEHSLYFSNQKRLMDFVQRITMRLDDDDLMDVIVDSMKTASTMAPVAEGADRVRHARFDLRQAPYTVAAHIEMPALPDSMRLSLTVALDPIHLTARLGCAAPDAQGIRSASIVASSPPWATVRFDSVEQSPAVCSTAGVVRRDRWRTTPVAGTGWVVGPDGHLRWGLFLGLGIGRA